MCQALAAQLPLVRLFSSSAICRLPPSSQTLPPNRNFKIKQIQLLISNPNIQPNYKNAPKIKSIAAVGEFPFPPCFLLYRGEGQVKYCRTTLSVVFFSSISSFSPAVAVSLMFSFAVVIFSFIVLPRRHSFADVFSHRRALPP